MDLLERFIRGDRAAKCDHRIPFRVGSRQARRKIGNSRA
jgi:hypothetical protein